MCPRQQFNDTRGWATTGLFPYKIFTRTSIGLKFYTKARALDSNNRRVEPGPDLSARNYLAKGIATGGGGHVLVEEQRRY